MLKSIAVIFGLVMAAIGVLGFIPSMTPGNLLLGYFAVNTAHNLIHLLTGILAILAGLSSTGAAIWFFRLFGIAYALFALHGFAYGSAPILDVVANNAADTWLHTAIAAVALVLGFGCCSSCKTC